MAESMVERVAKAIAGVRYLPICEKIRAKNRADPEVMPPEPMIETQQIADEWHRQQTLAAIAAMREPTEAMVNSGTNAMPVATHVWREDGAVKIRAIFPNDPEYVSPAGPWRAMIDAALAEQTPKAEGT
jgi:hypothetical protein